MATHCNTIREALLDFEWNADDRQRAAEVLAHLQNCDACRTAAGEFDRLRTALASDKSSPVHPRDGWASFESDLQLVNSRRAPRWPFWCLAAAAAVFFVVSITLFLELRTDRANQIALAQTPPAAVRPPALDFTPTEIRQQVSAFDQVSSTLDKHADWLLVSDQASDVGIAPKPVRFQQVLLLRLAVLRDKQLVSSADLAIVPGRKAKLSLPFGADQLNYEIGTSSDEQTKLAVSVALRKADGGGETLAALATTLQVNPGAPVNAGQFATTSGSYELNIAFARGSTKEVNP